MPDSIDFSQYTPEQLKQMQKQITEITKAQEPKKPRKPKKLPKVLKPEQIESYLAAINTKTKTGIRQMALSQIMILAGLRVQEVADLSVEDVDLVNDDIYVQQSKNATDRHIPIGATLKHWLQEWEAIRPESEWFFCSYKGTQLFQRNIREMVYEIGDRANIYIRDGGKKSRVNPHLFRHVFATNLLNDNYNIREVQALLGHALVNTTQIYTAVCLEDIRKKVKETEWL